MVRLARAVVSGGAEWKHERAGLVTALFEAGFADLPGVVAVVDESPPSPGISQWLGSDDGFWTASVEYQGKGEQGTLVLSSCPPDGALCVEKSAAGPRSQLHLQIAELLTHAGELLERRASPEVIAGWSRPVSKDDYAVLVAGRAAAVWYGLLPAPPRDKEGDRRRDPVARAVFLDPKIGLAQWIAGRRLYARGDNAAAIAAFQRASEARPHSVLWRADEAAALLRGGSSELAWTGLAELNRRAPSDLRFAPLRAKAALARGRNTEALAILTAVPRDLTASRTWLELRVQLADVLGMAASDYDELLERWQGAAPDLQEPVRRRIHLRVRDGRFEEALDLTAELASRGAQDEALKLHLGLSVALSQLDGAAQDAQVMGLDETAARIIARAALQAAPRVVPPTLNGLSDPIALLVRAETLILAGRPREGLEDVERVLRAHPWMPEALAVKTRALEAQGDQAAANVVWARLRVADPKLALALQGPRTAPGSTAAGVQVHSAAP